MKTFTFQSVTRTGTTEVSYPVEKLSKTEYTKNTKGEETVRLTFDDKSTRLLTGKDATEWRKQEDRYFPNKYAAAEGRERIEKIKAQVEKDKLERDRKQAEEARQAAENLEKLKIAQERIDAERAKKTQVAVEIQKEAVAKQRAETEKKLAEVAEESEKARKKVTKKKVSKKKTSKKKA